MIEKNWNFSKKQQKHTQLQNVNLDVKMSFLHSNAFLHSFLHPNLHPFLHSDVIYIHFYIHFYIMNFHNVKMTFLHPNLHSDLLHKYNIFVIFCTENILKYSYHIQICTWTQAFWLRNPFKLASLKSMGEFGPEWEPHFCF